MDDRPSMIGQLIGHYRVLEKIGAGAMGEVYRARDERLRRDVALKLIHPAAGDSPDLLRRFEVEARAAAALNHPNILAIYDVGLEGSTPYLVSELLTGRTLRQQLVRGAIPAREATDYALQIVFGLIAAHDHHIVHRDLKPENIFLTNESRIKILDFGVAKLQAPTGGGEPIENLPTITKSGSVIGTVAYMSPEQLRGKTVDHRSDIFSFGAILYEMFSGSRAFRGETEVDTITAVLRENPPAANLEQAAIPLGYRDVVNHCLEKEPDNRFQSAKDLAFALQTLSGSAGSTTQTSRIFQSSRKPTRLLPWAISAVLATATLLVGFYPRPPAPLPTYQRVTYETGTIYAARFAPDGQSIVYGAAWNNKPVHLFSTVGNSLLPQPLALADANLFAISRSNELAVVSGGSHSNQMETVGGVLARTPLAGGSPREIIPDVRWADWDAAGDLAVVHYAEGHCRLEYPTGRVLYQTNGWISHIRFSPTSDRIAFLDHPALWDQRGTVRVLDLSGHAQTLTREWESEHGLAWRPDGKEIWFTAAEKGITLQLMAVDLSGKLRVVLNSPVGLTLQDIAADGRVLVTLNNRRLQLSLMTVGSPEQTDISWHDWNVAKHISRDSQFVLFEDASEAAGPGYAVALRKLDGSLPIRLGEGSAGGLSPDNKWAISLSASEPTKITLLPIGQGQPRGVDLGGLEKIGSGWAHFLDSQRILVNGSEAGHTTRCYALALAGGKAQPITPEGTACGPSSPDARLLVGFEPGGSVGIYAVSGGSRRIIPGLRPGFNPVQWSSDGLYLYGYQLGEVPHRVYQIDAATGRQSLVTEITPPVPAGVVIIAPIVVGPDGKHIAYSYNQTLSTLYVITGLR